MFESVRVKTRLEGTGSVFLGETALAQISPWARGSGPNLHWAD